MGYSSQLKSPTGVPCTRSPLQTPLQSVPSTLAQAPRRGDHPGRRHAGEEDGRESDHSKERDPGSPLHFFRTSAAFTRPVASALSIVADSTLAPFCWARRPTQATRLSNGALCRRTERAPGPAGSLVREPASPASRAERSTITSSDSPVAAGCAGEEASSGATPCIQLRSARLLARRS